MKLFWVLLLSAVGWTQNQPLPELVTDPKESLRGLPGVMVDVGQSKCEGIVNPSLSKQDMEVKLRAAGIIVATLPFASLNLNANCTPLMIGNRRIGTVITFTLGVAQILWLPPQPVRVVLGKVWETGAVLVCDVVCDAESKCDDYFRSSLRNYMDTFVNDFLTVNPKR